MGNTLATLSFGIALKQFANLEEQHDENGLRKLRLSTGQKADEQGSDGGNRHQEMFVESLAVNESLSRLFQRIVTNQQIGYQIDQQQLPGRQFESVFYPNGNA